MKGPVELGIGERRMSYISDEDVNEKYGEENSDGSGDSDIFEADGSSLHDGFSIGSESRMNRQRTGGSNEERKKEVQINLEDDDLINVKKQLVD